MNANLNRKKLISISRYFQNEKGNGEDTKK